MECLHGSDKFNELNSFVNHDSDSSGAGKRTEELPLERPALKSGGVDWNEQAVRAARECLKYEPLSRKALIERLMEDGFTREQAEYAAKAIEK